MYMYVCTRGIMTQCGNDRDVVSIRNTFLVHDIIREVARNIRDCTDVRLVWGSLRLAPIIVNVVLYTRSRL